jgi:hypothetical protein
MGDAIHKAMLRPVLVAAGLTLLVTLVRLWGEIEHWNPQYWNREAGGGGALLGIGWLVIPFGFVFGRRLAQLGKGPKQKGRALLLALLAIVATLGPVMYVGNPESGLDVETMKTWMGYLLWFCPLATLVALAAWPAAWTTNLLYAVLARAPVVAVQYVAIGKHWGTHYEKVHPRLGQDIPDAERAHMLMLAQVCMWVPFTIVVGGLFAVLGALTVRKSG